MINIAAIMFSLTTKEMITFATTIFANYRGAFFK